MAIQYTITKPEIDADGKCLSCHWFNGERKANTEGTCRFNAPDTCAGQTVWPKVNSTEDFCGGYDYYGNWYEEESTWQQKNSET